MLEQHSISVRELYGRETKRNIKFDDRNRDLMMDIKLPGSTRWHNITIEQARKTKTMREELELTKLSQGRTIAGPSADRERAKALMLVYTPDRNTGLAAGANLIDIESGFQDNSCGREEGAAGAPGEEEEEEGSEEDSDESMNRLLQGRNAKNPYQ